MSEAELRGEARLGAVMFVDGVVALVAIFVEVFRAFGVLWISIEVIG